MNMKIQFDIITQKMIETGFTIVEYYVKPEIKNDISKINCDPIIPGDLLKFYNSYTQEYKLHYYKELNDNSSPIGKECI
ncbi:hypothetical protein LBMAG53_21930 [Planctomycetota bacterium]|nr:hypothetical protein LBMAG53_21930 [Planctomycetota bacterium]